MMLGIDIRRPIHKSDAFIHSRRTAPPSKDGGHLPHSIPDPFLSDVDGCDLHQASWKRSGALA